MAVMTFPAILAVYAILLSPHSTSSASAVSSDCNGRGYLPLNSTSLACVCDEPYAGDDCHLCASGYYGDPTGGGVCYLPCSGETRLLYNFTSAGVGVLPSWLITERPSLSDLPYCLWIIAPLISGPNSSSRDYGSLSSFSYSSSGSIFNSIPTKLRIRLRFRNDQSSQCFAETVIVYSGLPEFLTPLHLNSSLSPLGGGGTIVGSFTGSQLLNHSITVPSEVVTVVYLTSSQVPPSHLRGFNMTVSVQEKGSNLYLENATRDQAAISCELSTNSTFENESDDSIFLSSLVLTPLSADEGEETNSSSHAFDEEGQRCLRGRHHHTTVYDPCSNSLLIYGGLDLSEKPCGGVLLVNLSLDSPHNTSLGVGGERTVRWSWSNGRTPNERFLHTAVLLPCQQYSNGSQMFVFGGFTSRLVTSSELWLYSGGSQQWTQLESSPLSLAAHSATLTPDGRMVVIGGVNSGLHISPRTMIYNLVSGSWETLQTTTLDLPGVYGHSAVYDAVTNSVLVFGGYAYARPQARLSSSLYSLDLATLTWRRVQLANEVPSRMFHSMVAVGNLLVIHGGLLSQQNPSGLEGVCPSNDVTLIDLAAVCRGKPALTLSLGGPSTCEYGRFGHTLVTDGEEVFVIGGQDLSSDALVSLLHLPSLPSLSCSLAQTTVDCLSIPGCSSCISNSTDNFITCYNASDTSTTLLCSNQGGVLFVESNDTLSPSSRQLEPLTCEQFESCGACLSTDAALELGCVWCICEERCVPAPPSDPTSNDTSSCPCATRNSTFPDVCILDNCAIPSCADCQAEGDCRWLSLRIRDNPAVPNSIVVLNIPEWGCYSNHIHSVIVNRLHFDASVRSCPASCNRATSCDTCVAMTTPTGGNGTCVWAEYNRECLSSDVVPLSCSLGGCGPVLSSRAQCPSPCRSRDTCSECLKDPTCVWLNNEGGNLLLCVETREVDSVLLNLPNDDIMVYYYKCPLGMSCYQYCHGNSESCLVEGGVSQATELAQPVRWVREDMYGDVVCLDCEGFSHGNRCQSCLTGYFNSNSEGEGEAVTCQTCTCNGHDFDDCDPVSGFCLCQNHTRSIACQGSICSTFSQCSLCESGYAGNPRNNGQCYRQVISSIVGAFSLPANQTTSFYFGPGSDGYFFSNVDVHAALVVARGILDVYISTDPSDVMVTLNRETWVHELSFQPGVSLVDPSSRGRRELHHTRRQEDSDQSRKSSDRRQDRQGIQHSLLSSSPDVGLYHFVVDDRLSLVVSHDQEDFSSSDYYITVQAEEDSQFFFYYRQDVPRLNIYIFFSIFECLFVLGSTLLVMAYQVGVFFIRRRRRRRERRRRERRANRPLVKLLLYLGEKKRVSTKKKKSVLKQTSLPPLEEEKLKSAFDVNKEREQVNEGKSVNGGTKKRVRIADTAYSCSREAGAIELETHSVAGASKDATAVKNKKKRKYQILSPDDICRWPVCIQPTANEVVCLSTVLVQLPSRSKKSLGQLCSGTAMFVYPKASFDEQDRERGKRKLRLRRKHRLAPAPDDPAVSNTTQL